MNENIVALNKALTDAQKHLMNWFFQKLSVMGTEQEEEVYQLFTQIGQIRGKLEEINGELTTI